MMRAILLCLSLLMAMPAWAVQPDEILPDPALESRARDLSRQLRCPVCQGESIDDSNAPISRDLRLYVRERLVAGDTDQQAIDAVVDRYGEFVLFEPRASGMNWVLWLAGPVMALTALLIGWVFLRSRRMRNETPPEDLTEAERERLNSIMRD